MTNDTPYRGSPVTRDYLAGISATVANEYAEHQDSINRLAVTTALSRDEAAALVGEHNRTHATPFKLPR